jgi:PDZ domain
MRGRRGGPGATRGGPDFRHGGFARIGPELQLHTLNRIDGQTPSKGVALGVAVSNPDAELRSQLDLPDGIGLVVQQVLPNTLAASSGLKQYDVLQKIDDQLVVNTDQVGVLIRMHKPGDKITFTVIRHGKSQELTSKIAKPRSAKPGSNWGQGSNWGFNRFGPGQRPMREGPNGHRGPRPNNTEPPPTRDRNDATPPHPTAPQTAAPATQPSGSASASATVSDVLRQFADLFVD